MPTPETDVATRIATLAAGSSTATPSGLVDIDQRYIHAGGAAPAAGGVALAAEPLRRSASVVAGSEAPAAKRRLTDTIGGDAASARTRAVAVAVRLPMVLLTTSWNVYTTSAYGSDPAAKLRRAEAALAAMAGPSKAHPSVTVAEAMAALVGSVLRHVHE